MAANSSDYKNRIAKYDQQIADYKRKISQKQSKLVSTTKKSHVYITPIKNKPNNTSTLPNTSPNTPSRPNSNTSTLPNSNTSTLPNSHTNTLPNSNTPSRPNSNTSTLPNSNTNTPPNSNNNNNATSSPYSNTNTNTNNNNNTNSQQSSTMADFDEEMYKKMEKQAKEEAQKNEKQLKQFFTFSQSLRDCLEEKAKYIEIDYQKQTIKWQQQRIKLKKQISDLNIKMEQKDEKIANLIQTVAELKAQLKEKKEILINKQKLIEKLSEDNKRYREQNTQVKLKNKNLAADNKIVVTHLDKLLKKKTEDDNISAKNAFDEQQKRVINALYNKSKPAMDYPQNPQMLPSQRNQLSNKLKLQNLIQEYKEYRRESSMQVRKLKEDNETKRIQIQAQANQIAVLQQKVSSLEDLRNLEKSKQNQRQIVMKKMEDQIANLTAYNDNLVKSIENNERIPRFKYQIGTLVNTSKRQCFFDKEGLIKK